MRGSPAAQRCRAGPGRLWAHRPGAWRQAGRQGVRHALGWVSLPMQRSASAGIENPETEFSAACQCPIRRGSAQARGDQTRHARVGFAGKQRCARAGKRLVPAWLRIAQRGRARRSGRALQRQGRCMPSPTRTPLLLRQARAPGRALGPTRSRRARSQHSARPLVRAGAAVPEGSPALAAAVQLPPSQAAPAAAAPTDITLYYGTTWGGGRVHGSVAGGAWQDFPFSKVWQELRILSRLLPPSCTAHTTRLPQCLQPLYYCSPFIIMRRAPRSPAARPPGRVRAWQVAARDGAGGQQQRQRRVSL
jgi:hypothetical protein